MRRRRSTSRSARVWPAFTDLTAGLLLAVLAVHLRSVVDPESIASVRAQRDAAVAELSAARVRAEAAAREIAEAREAARALQAELDGMKAVGSKVVERLQSALRVEGIASLVNDYGNLEIAADLVFNSAESAVPAANRGTAAKLGQVVFRLLQDPQIARVVATVLVIGHTDGVDTQQKNLPLSTQRAVNLVQLWSNEQRATANLDGVLWRCVVPKILAGGFGEARPAGQGPDESRCRNPPGAPPGCAADRRIELRIVPKRESAKEILGCSLDDGHP